MSKDGTGSTTISMQRSIQHIQPLPGSSKFNFGVNIFHGMYGCCPIYDISKQKEFQPTEPGDLTVAAPEVQAIDASNTVLIDSTEYAVPHNLAVMTNYKMTVSDKSIMYENEGQWEKEWQVSVGASVSGKTPWFSASASANASMYSFNSLFTKSTKKTVVTTVVCSLFNATFTGPTTSALSPVFLQRLAAAKADKNKWYDMFDMHGTHVVLNGTFGGMLLAMTRFGSDAVKKVGQKRLEASVNVAVSGAFASGSLSASAIVANSSDLQSNSESMEYTATAIGGVVSKNMDEYQASVVAEPELLLDPLARTPFKLMAITDVIKSHALITGNATYSLNAQQQQDMEDAFTAYVTQSGKSSLFPDALPVVFSGQKLSLYSGSYDKPRLMVNNNYQGIGGIMVGYALSHMMLVNNNPDASRPLVGVLSKTISPVAYFHSSYYTEIHVNNPLPGTDNTRLVCLQVSALTAPLLPQEELTVLSRSILPADISVNVYKFDHDVILSAKDIVQQPLPLLTRGKSITGPVTSEASTILGFYLVRFKPSDFGINQSISDYATLEVSRYSKGSSNTVLIGTVSRMRHQEQNYSPGDVSADGYLLIPVVPGDVLSFNGIGASGTVYYTPFELGLKSISTNRLKVTRNSVQPFVCYQADADGILQVQCGQGDCKDETSSDKVFYEVAVFASASANDLDTDVLNFSPLNGQVKNGPTMRAYGCWSSVTLTVPIIIGDYYKVIVSSFRGRISLDTFPILIDDTNGNTISHDSVNYFYAEMSKFTLAPTMQQQQ